MQKIEEARKFLVIEFEDFGVTRGIAQDFRAEERLAKIYIEYADSKGRERGKKGANGRTRNRAALRERAEADSMRGTSK